VGRPELTPPCGSALALAEAQEGGRLLSSEATIGGNGDYQKLVPGRTD